MANTRYVLYLVLAIISLHMLSLPLVVGVNVFIDTDENKGKIKVGFMTIPVFSKKLDIKRIISDIKNRKDEDDNGETEHENSEKTSKVKAFLLDCAIRILKRMRVRRAELDSKIGTGDAGMDGMAVGIIRIMYMQFCAFFGFEGHDITISPEYNSEVVFFDFFGIFSLCFADIIVAVCGAVLSALSHTVKRRNYANVTR